jgi:hypothetical protein
MLSHRKLTVEVDAEIADCRDWFDDGVVQMQAHVSRVEFAQVDG